MKKKLLKNVDFIHLGPKESFLDQLTWFYKIWDFWPFFKPLCWTTIFVPKSQSSSSVVMIYEHCSIQQLLVNAKINILSARLLPLLVIELFS